MPEDPILFAGSVLAGFFAIMNPITITPIFLGLVEDFDPPLKKRVAGRSLLTAFAIVVVFMLLGKVIFELFGLTWPAFRITGGILIFKIGFDMLHGRPSKVHAALQDGTSARESADRIAVSPLAIPILAGPGTIAAAMNFVGGGSLARGAITAAIFAGLCLLTYLMFVSGPRLVAYLGESMISVITRLMGLILAVMGTGMVIQGFKAVS